MEPSKTVPRATQRFPSPSIEQQIESIPALHDEGLPLCFVLSLALDRIFSSIDWLTDLLPPKDWILLMHCLHKGNALVSPTIPSPSRSRPSPVSQADSTTKSAMR